MKRIILAIATIVASTGLTFAATTTAWSDTATATDITVVSGSADLQISNGGAYGQTADSPFNVTGLEPGVTIEQPAFYLRQIVSDPSASGMSLKGKIIFSAITPTSVTPDEGDIQIQVYEIGGATGTESDWHSLASWKSTTTGYAFNSNLDSTNRTKQYGIRVKFGSSPDSAWQNTTLKFDMEITGTQNVTP